ncbi:hypothetical protein SAMN05216404_106170 [Nitrosospira multiformis]|uniref:Uncharacterized protein n=1 Tax=Nitrosospira multiformis TaxID=1231 RepID=A0A1H8ISI9_9PROT|nr:hypothetical protein [Nitrosospira multiformis]SEN71514.1 hypothetical protein SAMN05216404_106170 [Nitrosospira multiformis]
MSAKIYNAVSENFIRQMRNWALTTAGVVSSNYLISSCYDPAPRDTYGDGQRQPVLMGEAEDVNNALLQLPLRYRQAVSLFWQYEDRPLAWFGRRLMIDWRTFEVRVMHGHELLRSELAKQAEKVAIYREAAMRTSTLDRQVL